MINAKRRIDRIVKLHREWLQDSAPGLLDRTDRRLTENLTEASLPALRSTDSLLSRFATYFGTKGVVELIDERAGAWDAAYLSCMFHLHQLRLGFALWSRLADEPGISLTKVACALCFSLANGLSEWTRLFADIISQAEWNDQMVKRPYWQERKFEPFALRLAQIAASNGEIAPAPSDSLGVYSDLIAHWNSPDALAAAMEQICDYHCEHMDDTGSNGDWDPEFAHPPFDLIPWEILAIQQVRQRQGLATPEVKHPLLAHVATFVPRNELPVDDRIRAVERLRESLSMTIKT